MSRSSEQSDSDGLSASLREHRLISAFPATGKSYYAKRHDNVADSDSSTFSWVAPGQRHPDWPQNYLTHIKGEMLGGRVVLVSTHSEVRKMLSDDGLPFTLVYPARALRNRYADRMRRRGSSEQLISVVVSNWDEWITDMCNQPCAYRIVLGAGQYLSDVLAAAREAS